MDLGLEIKETNVGIRISIVKMPCGPIFRKTDNFDFFGPILPNNEFWGRNFKNLSPDSDSALLRYHVYQFSVKTDNLDFFAPNLPKKEIRI